MCEHIDSFFGMTI